MRIRYFAGAAQAAGLTEEDVLVGADLSAAALVAQLGAEREHLARVLAVSTLLVDGRPLHDRSTVVPRGAQVDVLPPFAGG